jgi:hypothetical protein
MNRKAVASLLALCLGATVVYGVCQYAKEQSSEGKMDCSHSCFTAFYVPSVMLCADTTDTLRCREDSFVQTTIWWAIGTCTGTVCENVTNGVSPDTYVLAYCSDDGCLTGG